MIFYLSQKQILILHWKQVGRYGGASGVRDAGALDAAVARPQLTFDGEDLYPDLPAKAAALLHSLISNHPFLDGNKRVGVMAAELFLFTNGRTLEVSDGGLIDLTLGVAKGELEAEEVAIWIRQRIRPSSLGPS